MSRAILAARRSAGALGLVGSLLLAQFDMPALAAPPGELQLAQAAPPGVPEADDPTPDLQRRLQITPAQQPQFEAFAQAMRQNEAALQSLEQRFPPGQRRNALAELQAQSQAADIEAQGLRRLVPAFQALYAVLSDQQKRTADQMFAGPPTGRQPAAGR